MQTGDLDRPESAGWPVRVRRTGICESFSWAFCAEPNRESLLGIAKILS